MAEPSPQAWTQPECCGQKQRRVPQPAGPPGRSPTSSAGCTCSRPVARTALAFRPCLRPETVTVCACHVCDGRLGSDGAGASCLSSSPDVSCLWPSCACPCWAEAKQKNPALLPPSRQLSSGGPRAGASATGSACAQGVPAPVPAIRLWTNRLGSTGRSTLWKPRLGKSGICCCSVGVVEAHSTHPSFYASRIGRLTGHGVSPRAQPALAEPVLPAEPWLAEQAVPHSPLRKPLLAQAEPRTFPQVLLLRSCCSNCRWSPGTHDHGLRWTCRAKFSFGSLYRYPWIPLSVNTSCGQAPAKRYNQNGKPKPQ